jgi:CheY-like chemotaxis protein
MIVESDHILVVDDEQSACYVLSNPFARMGRRTSAISCFCVLGTEKLAIRRKKKGGTK